MRPASRKYKQLLDSIGLTIKQARQNAIRAVNTELVKANWEIGRHIVEFEQHGQERAEYGSELLTRLSRDLRQRYGKGFGRRNILDMRRFYLTYQKWQTVSAKLSWSHYIALVGISDDTARKFYEKHTLNENLSVRELERLINSSLFERLALSKDKKGVLQLSEKGDNEPIGIILSAEKDEVLVEFATGGISNKIFVSKYQLYLPNKKQLQKKVKAIMDSK